MSHTMKLWITDYLIIDYNDSIHSLYEKTTWTDSNISDEK